MKETVVIEGEVSLLAQIDGEVEMNALLDGEPSNVINVGRSINDHDRLINRDLADQHPISAITGLQDALDSKVATEDLAVVAFSGDVKDLTQTEVLIINCGTSTEVI